MENNGGGAAAERGTGQKLPPLLVGNVVWI